MPSQPETQASDHGFSPNQVYYIIGKISEFGAKLENIESWRKEVATSLQSIDEKQDHTNEKLDKLIADNAANRGFWRGGIGVLTAALAVSGAISAWWFRLFTTGGSH